MWVGAQVLSRGSRAISGSGRLHRSGQLNRTASRGGDGAPKPRQTNLELELVAVGIGLRFVELDDSKQVRIYHCHCHNSSICGFDSNLADGVGGYESNT